MSGDLMKVLSDDVDTVEARGPDLDDDGLRTLYEALVVVRALDERCMRLQRAGRIAFYVPSSGQEAAAVGAAYAMISDDWVFPSYRDAGMYLLRGGSLKSWLDQAFGNGDDLTRGRQLPCHASLPDGRFVTVSGPVATQIPQAVGCAMAMRIRGARSAVLVSFGDGATSESGFHSGMNLAGVFGAPVIFLCQNNQWAASHPLARQTAAETLAQKAVAYGFEGVRVDGNDVLAVYKAVLAAREKAVEGGGPTLVEALTYRSGPHSSADATARYRSDEEVRAWIDERDPISRYREYLERRGVWDGARQEELAARTRQRLQDAVEAAEAAPGPAPETLFDDVVSEPGSALREQRRRVAGAGEPSEDDAGENP